MDEILKQHIKAKMCDLSEAYDSLSRKVEESERTYKAVEAHHLEYAARAEKQLAEFRGAYQALEGLLAEAEEGGRGEGEGAGD